MQKPTLLFRVVLCLAFVAVLGGPAVGGERFGVGLKAGTLGIGVDLTGRINNWVSVRGTLNQIDINKSYSASDIDYDGKFKLGPMEFSRICIRSEGGSASPGGSSTTATRSGCTRDR